MKIRVYKRVTSVIGVMVCVLLCFGLGGCSGRQAEKEKPDDDAVPEDMVEREGSPSYIPDELVGLFDTEGQARDAAELYGIELLSYDNQVAVFRCEGDPKALIEQGEANGWPQLSLNRVYKSFDEGAKRERGTRGR